MCRLDMVPQMLYDNLPYVPGYQSTDKEALSADPGAMPWQNLPYSRVQHEAVFEHGEFPLWNRYNSGGVPLFGQGQSQILDPLHWIAVAGEGNGWAWDVKFLLSKLIFLAGIGASILLMTRNRLVSIVVMVSASFIGFFYFRFNHPIFFNLTYTSWLFFFYLHLVQDLQLSCSMRKEGWAGLAGVRDICNVTTDSVRGNSKRSTHYSWRVTFRRFYWGRRGVPAVYENFHGILLSFSFCGWLSCS